MKKCFVVANWKSNKTEPEAKEWLQEVSSIKYLASRSPRFGEAGRSGQVSSIKSKEIIICPPFTLLSQLKSYILDHKLPLKLGAQDISPFGEGQYTGEVNGKQLKEFCDYVLIGHSERREHFNEDDALLEKKVARAKESGLMPLFCVQGEETPIPVGIDIVAYEPLSAIGTGNPDTPQNANDVARRIRERHRVTSVLYGGSVTEKNASEFMQMPQMCGVLVGGASLDPSTFVEILKHA